MGDSGVPVRGMRVGPRPSRAAPGRGAGRGGATGVRRPGVSARPPRPCRPKHELLDEVWGSRFVSESALTSRIKSARRAVGDTGHDQRVIRTVHGRGYRFVAEVETGVGSGGRIDDDPLPAAIEALAARRRGHRHRLEVESVTGAGSTDCSIVSQTWPSSAGSSSAEAAGRPRRLPYRCVSMPSTRSRSVGRISRHRCGRRSVRAGAGVRRRRPGRRPAAAGGRTRAGRGGGGGQRSGARCSTPCSSPTTTPDHS